MTVAPVTHGTSARLSGATEVGAVPEQIGSEGSLGAPAGESLERLVGVNSIVPGIAKPVVRHSRGVIRTYMLRDANAQENRVPAFRHGALGRRDCIEAEALSVLQSRARLLQDVTTRPDRLSSSRSICRNIWCGGRSYPDTSTIVRPPCESRMGATQLRAQVRRRPASRRSRPRRYRT